MKTNLPGVTSFLPSMSRNVRVGVQGFRLVLLVIDEQTHGCPAGVVFVPRPR